MPELSNWIGRLSELSDDDSFRNRAWALAQALNRESSIEALLSGFEMANRFSPDHDFVNKQFDDCDTTINIAEWIEYCRKTTDTSWDRASAAMSCWDACGKLKGLGLLFHKDNWSGLSPDGAFDLYEVFRDCCYADGAELMESSMSVLNQIAPEYFRSIRTVTRAYQAKAIQIFRSIANCWQGNRLEFALRRTLDLIPVVCRDPFDRSCIPSLYSAMLDLEQTDFEKLLEANPDSILKLDYASRDQNDATLIARGLARLAATRSKWLVDWLIDRPGPTLKCALTLGCLSKTQHLEALNLAMSYAVFQTDAADLTELARRIVENLPLGVHDPVPRKVKLYARGEFTLTTGQQARAIEKILDELPRTRIHLLRHSALTVLADSLNVRVEFAEKKSLQHAIKLQNLAMENRRALRKFLKAYLAGEDDYLNKHPANQEWLKAHPGIDFKKWQSGLTICQPSVDGAPLTLSLELNPIEALQLGSYVGSCLGIGGSWLCPLRQSYWISIRPLSTQEINEAKSLLDSWWRFPTMNNSLPLVSIPTV